MVETGMGSTGEHKADRIDRPGDELAVRIPSSAYLGLMVVSVAASITLYMMKRKEAALFVGLWAPTVLNFGVYNKLLRISRGTSEASASFAH